MTQRDMVRTHLYEGYPITPAKAMAEYGIWRLAAVIHKLREEGLPIRTINKRSLSGKKYAEYRLVEPDEHPYVGDEESGYEDPVTLEVGDVVAIIGCTPESEHYFPIGALVVVREVLTGAAFARAEGEEYAQEWIYDCTSYDKDLKLSQYVIESDLRLYAKGSEIVDVE